MVINGNMGQQNKERDGREYYGKGKGKMFEAPDSKWVKVAERGHRRPSNNHETTGEIVKTHCTNLLVEKMRGMVLQNWDLVAKKLIIELPRDSQEQMKVRGRHLRKIERRERSRTMERMIRCCPPQNFNWN